LSFLMKNSLEVFHQVLPYVRDINAAVESGVVAWTRLLLNLVDRQRSRRHSTEIPDLLSILQALFRYGADPNATSSPTCSVWVELCNFLHPVEVKNVVRNPAAWMELLFNIIMMFMDAGADVNHPRSLTAADAQAFFPPRLATPICAKLSIRRQRADKSTDKPPTVMGFFRSFSMLWPSRRG